MVAAEVEIVVAVETVDKEMGMGRIVGLVAACKLDRVGSKELQ